jgi:hypothetical protein
VEWLDARAIRRIGLAEFDLLAAAFPEIPPVSLRKLLRDTGRELAPLIEGVRQEDFDQLARTLTSLAREYEAGDAFVRQRCRRVVITAKDHAKLAARLKPGKAEMAEWMIVWLENPGVFEVWCKLNPRLNVSP